MPNKMLIDATHPEETRVVVLRGNRVEEFDFESASRKQLRGNIYLAKVTRVEPSLQAAFVDYGGNRHGFLAFSEIHPDYYQIPVADRQALIDEEERAARAADAEADHRAGRRAERDRERQSERQAGRRRLTLDSRRTKRKVAAQVGLHRLQACGFWYGQGVAAARASYHEVVPNRVLCKSHCPSSCRLQGCPRRGRSLCTRLWLPISCGRRSLGTLASSPRLRRFCGGLGRRRLMSADAGTAALRADEPIGFALAARQIN